MPTRFLECNPIVTVSDLAAAKSFYTRELGFSLDFDYGDVLGMAKDGVLILLIVSTSPNARQKPGTSNLSFLTDQVDELFTRCASAGVTILVEPSDRPYGQRDFAIQDPDGNVLTFGCALTSSAHL